MLRTTPGKPRAFGEACVGDQFLRSPHLTSCATCEAVSVIITIGGPSLPGAPGKVTNQAFVPAAVTCASLVMRPRFWRIDAVVKGTFEVLLAPCWSVNVVPALAALLRTSF